MKLILNIKSYTFLLLFTGLLGTQIISINLGFIQLSPYRILLILAPFVFIKVKKSTVSQLSQSINYKYFAFMLFWVVYSLFPLLWVKDFTAWAKIYIFLLSGFITTWFIGLYFTRKIDIINALKVVELLSFLFGMIAVDEIFTGNYLFLNERNSVFYQMRSQLVSSIGLRIPISVFSNPNNYALFLLFSVFASLGLSKVKRTRNSRLLSLVFTFFFIFLLISTQSRSGFMGLVLGFTIYGFVLLKRINAKNSWKFILVIIGALLFIIPRLLENKELFETLLTIDLNASSGSDATRLNLIKNGFHFLINSFFMGVGLGNIEYHMANFGIYSTGSITNIHNWWMEILVSSGVFVFIFYIVVYLKNLKRLYKFSCLNFDKDLQHLSSVFFSFLVAFFITSMGASSLMYNEWIWIIMAIVMSFVNIYTTKSH